MRQLYPGSGRPSVRALLQTVLEAGTSGRHSHSLLLPDNFVHYLREVYFANFDPKNPNVFSRHSIAHGVAPAADFTQSGYYRLSHIGSTFILHTRNRRPET
jgi:hypothetical protein